MDTTFLLKNSFHTNMCQQLVEDIQFKQNNYFYFLGKIAESSETVLVDSLKSENDTRSEMISFSKITSSDVSYVIPRIDWTSGVVYTQYDSTVNLNGTNFYVLTADFNVYKCLSNNKNSPSTVMPYDEDVSVLRTSDGYLWKYMYTVPLYKRNKFLSPLKMPVQTALSERFYNSGALSSVIVKNGGINYTLQDTNTIVITGDGTDAVVTPVIDVNGTVYDVEIVNPGHGYTYATAIIQSGNGTGCILEVVLSQNDFISEQSNIEQTSLPGAIHNIVITAGGNSYQNAYITVTGDGQGFEAQPVIENGIITDIAISNTGYGYSYANITISGDNRVFNPLAESASAYVIISPTLGHGRNAVYELGCSGVCIYSLIKMNSSFQDILQDFREYGIIKSLRDVYSNSIVTMQDGLFTYTASINTLVGIEKDEILFTGESKFRVVDIIPSSSKIILTPITNDELFFNTTLTALNNTSRTYIISDIISVPNANKYSGNILFVSNSEEFVFSDEQEITIKTYLNL